MELFVKVKKQEILNTVEQMLIWNGSSLTLNFGNQYIVSGSERLAI